MATPIIHDEQRIMERNEALRDYGIDPAKATERQKELADCIAQSQKQALKEMMEMEERNNG